MHQVVSYLTTLVNQLSQADLIVIAGALATGVQYIVHRFQVLSSPLKWILSFVLPLVTALVPYVDLHRTNYGMYAGLAYFAAQVLYFTIEQIKDSAVKSVAAAV